MIRQLLALALSCAMLLPASAASAADAQIVFATPGEDASTEAQVSWHASVAGTRLEVTKKSDASFAEATSVDCGSVPQDTTFSSASFYRCSARLTGLETDTEYQFRVGASAPAASQTFKTAFGRGPFSFLWMSDMHAYPSIASRMDKVDALVARGEQLQDDLKFMLITGDQMAHGATYAQWQEFAASPFTRGYLLATTPGNHDYYDGSANTIDDRYYNAGFLNPANGCSASPNSSYWFRYDNALFIALNSEARTSAQMDAQKAWMRSVIEGSDAQYVIVFTHRALFAGSTTTAGSGTVRKTSVMYTPYGALLEELGVDMVLAGDDHVYVRTKAISGGAVATSGRGTVYLTANQIGDRGALAAANLGEYGAAIYGGTSSSGSISTAAIITVGEDAIDGVLYDSGGTVRDSFTLAARRAAPVDSFDKAAYANSFAARVNPPDLTRGILAFTDQGWDRVRTIDVLDADAAGTSYASFAPRAGMTETTFGALVPGKTYRLTVHVLFKEGDARDFETTLVNKVSPGSYRDLRLEEDGGRVFLKWVNELVPEQIGSIKVSVGTWSADVPVDGDSVEVTPGLQVGENLVGFAVVDRYGDQIFAESLSYTFVPPDAGTQPAADGGSAPHVADDAGEGSAPPDEDPTETVGAGCSCASTRSSATPLLLFAVAAGIGGAARRRRAG